MKTLFNNVIDRETENSLNEDLTLSDILEAKETSQGIVIENAYVNTPEDCIFFTLFPEKSLA